MALIKAFLTTRRIGPTKRRSFAAQPPVKGAASRLAALGPAGPPFDWTAAASLASSREVAHQRNRAFRFLI